MKNKLILLFIVLLNINCSFTNLDKLNGLFTNCDGKFSYNENEFSKEELIWLNNSQNRWNNFIGYNYISLHHGQDRECFIKKEILNSVYSAKHNENTGLISIDPSKPGFSDQSYFESIIMHEIGHCIGFNHIGLVDKDALMSQVAGPDFSDIDYIECKRINLCL